jgi:hypothetical protein
LGVTKRESDIFADEHELEDNGMHLLNFCTFFTELDPVLFSLKGHDGWLSHIQFLSNVCPNLLPFFFSSDF